MTTQNFEQAMTDGIFEICPLVPEDVESVEVNCGTMYVTSNDGTVYNVSFSECESEEAESSYEE